MSHFTIIWNYLRARANLESRGDRGVITAEMAVVIFLLVAGAIVVAGILITAATNNAENVPVPSSP
jgi:hypothetical protein